MTLDKIKTLAVIRGELKFFHVEPAEGAGIVVFRNRRGALQLTKVEIPAIIGMQATTDGRAGVENDTKA